MDKNIKSWIYALIGAAIGLGIMKLLGVNLIKLTEFLYPALPACLIFGPTCFMFGIIALLGGKESSHFKKGVLFLVAGDLMITYALVALAHLAWH